MTTHHDERTNANRLAVELAEYRRRWEAVCMTLGLDPDEANEVDACRRIAYMGEELELDRRPNYGGTRWL